MSDAKHRKKFCRAPSLFLALQVQFMYKTAVYTLVNAVITHQKQQKRDITQHDIA